MASPNHINLDEQAKLQSCTTQIIADSSIVDSKISLTADIAFSKLESLLSGHILVGNASDVVTAVTPSGDITISNTGVLSINSNVIVDADINASAAIVTSKLADAANFLLRNASNTLTSGIRFTYSTPQTFLSAGDLVTKSYVDSVATGLDIKASVRAATTGNIALSGTQTIDGVSLIAGDRVLVKNQVLGENNGIYVVASGAWSRSEDADEDFEVTNGMFMFVEEGTLNQATGWVLTTANPIIVGTTPLVFTQFSSAGVITAGTGLTLTGNTIDFVSADTSLTVNADDVAVNRDPAGALSLSGSGIAVSVDNSTLEINSNALRVKDLGITTAKLNNSAVTPDKLDTSVAGSGLSGGAGSALDVNVTNLKGLQIVTDSLEVKVDTSTITFNGSGELTTSASVILTSSIVTREIPSGAIDGVNDTFTIANSPAPVGSEHVFLNGVLQNVGITNDYTISGNTITFTFAPIPGDTVLVSYFK